MATQKAKGAKTPTTRAGKSTAARSATTKTAKSSRSATTGSKSTGKITASKTSKSTARKAPTKAAAKTTTKAPTKGTTRTVSPVAKSSAPTALHHASRPTKRTRRGPVPVKQGYATGSPLLAHPLGTIDLGVRLTRLDPTAREELRELDELVASAEEITVVGNENRRLPIKGVLLEVLAMVMGALDRGTTVTVLGEDDSETELTSQEAADLLNVSRPYVVKLARDGVLPHRRVGNRHRFTLADVLAYREQMRATTEAALTELAPGGGYTAADF